MNYSTSKQQQQATTGLRGTQYDTASADQLYGASTQYQNLANSILADPLRFQGQTGSQLFPSGQYGFGQNVDTMMKALGNQMFSNASASAANRGQTSVYDLGGIIGSAINQAAPSLIPQALSFNQWQFGLPMNLNQYAMGVAQGPAQNWQVARGAQSQGSGSSFGFGVDPSAVGSTGAKGSSGIGMFMA